MNKKQKNILIGGLLALVLIMAIGYAAFATQLNIGGTAETTTTWNIRITNIRTVDLTSINGTAISNNGAYDVQAPTYDNTNGLTATFSTGLTSPGDTRVYEVEVSNLGSIDADITKVLTNNSNNPAIEFTYDGVSSTSVLTNAGAYTKSSLSTTEPFSLPATTGNVKYVYVTVKYSESVQGQPTSTTGSMTLTLNAVQEGNSSSGGSGGDTPSGTQTVYAWNTTAITVGTSTINDLASTKTAQPYYTSAADVMSASNYTIFNKYTVENGIITEGYSCQTFGITGFEPVCLKMSTDGSAYGDDSTGNKGILMALSTNGTFTGNNPVGYCNSIPYNTNCIVGNLTAYAYSSGDVRVYGDGTIAYCNVSHYGDANCTEE